MGWGWFFLLGWDLFFAGGSLGCREDLGTLQRSAAEGAAGGLELMVLG